MNHLWQSTIFALAAALLTLAVRKNHARIRHSIWLVASLKFLIPFSLLVSAGSHLQWSNPPVPLTPRLARDSADQPAFFRADAIHPASRDGGAFVASADRLVLWICRRSLLLVHPLAPCAIDGSRRLPD